MKIGYFENLCYKINLPNDFNVDIYRKLNPELYFLSNNDLMKEYISNGYFENKKYKLSLPYDFDIETYKKLNNINAALSDDKIIENYINNGYFVNKQYKITISDDFNPNIYKKLNPELNKLSKNELIEHYTKIGFFENLNYTETKYIPEPLFITNIKNISKNLQNSKNNNIKKFTIYGERCSGTNYIENLINMNFNIELTWEYGWKHFFGFDNLDNSDDTLFICIIRDPYEWINSLYKNPWHICYNIKNDKDKFINNEFWSYDEEKLILGFYEEYNDRNIYTKERYKNIFNLRYTKLNFLLNDMPLKVKNYIFIKYEDLINHFDLIMNKIKDCGLEVKDNIQFPINTDNYKNSNKKYVKNNNYPIKKNTIYNHPDFDLDYEKKLGYIENIKKVKNNRKTNK